MKFRGVPVITPCQKCWEALGYGNMNPMFGISEWMVDGFMKQLCEECQRNNKELLDQ